MFAQCHVQQNDLETQQILAHHIAVNMSIEIMGIWGPLVVFGQLSSMAIRAHILLRDTKMHLKSCGSSQNANKKMNKDTRVVLLHSIVGDGRGHCVQRVTLGLHSSNL